jgi:hypothetical protein
MKKMMIVLLISVVGFFQSDAQTADEVVQKWTVAMGGAEKLASIQSIYLENELNIMNNEAPGVTYILNGKGCKTETDFNGQKIIDCYALNNGWNVNPLAGQPEAKQMPEAQIKWGQLRLEAAGPLFNYAAKKSVVELMGKEDVNGVQAYKVKLTTASGMKDIFFLDPYSFYILKESSTMNVNGQELEITNLFSDYRKTDNGYIMPYSTAVTLPGLSIAMTTKKIEVNRSIDPVIFDMPKK